MIFDLAQDFHDAVAAMPAEHTRHRTVKFLEEAIRRDIHFIARHPTSLFQCIWNTCWPVRRSGSEGGWYACPVSPEGAGLCSFPEDQSVLKRWSEGKERITPGFFWLRRVFLSDAGCAPVAVIRLDKTPIDADVQSCSGLVAVCDGSIRSYDTTRHLETWRLEADLDGVFFAVALSPDEKCLACAARSGRADGFVAVWDMSERVLIHRFDIPSCRSGLLRFAEGGRVLGFSGIARTGTDSLVALWDVRRGSRLWQRKLTGCVIRTFAFMPQDASFVTGHGDGTCRFWSIHDGRCLKRLRPHTDAVTAISVSPSGANIATSSKDGFCRVWSAGLPNRASVRLRHAARILLGKGAPVFAQHSVAPTAISFLDEERIMSGDADGHCFTWNVSDGRLLGSPCSLSGRCSALCVSCDRQRIMAVSEGDRTCRLFDAKAIGAATEHLHEHIQALRFIEGRHELLVHRADGDLHALTIRDSVVVDAKRRARTLPPARTAVSAARDVLLVVANDGRWQTFVLATAEKRSGRFRSPVSPGTVVAVASDGSRVAFFSRELLETIETRTGQRSSRKLAIIPKALSFEGDQSLLVLGTSVRLSNFTPRSTACVRFPSKEDLGAQPVFEVESQETGELDGVVLGDGLTLLTARRLSGEREMLTRFTVGQTERPEAQWRWTSREAARLEAVSDSVEGALVSLISKGECLLLDTRQDEQEAFLCPVSGTLTASAVESGGNLMALGYAHGGMEILARMCGQDDFVRGRRAG